MHCEREAAPAERELELPVMRVVTLYARDGCHLCDEAREALLALRGVPPRFALREIDIERDDALHARYLERIPVVEIDGEVVSELAFEPRRLLLSLDTVRP
jgi:glutaredoxin